MDCLNLLLKLGYKSKKEFGLKKPLESFRPIDVNSKDKYGNTPLLRAIRSGNKINELVFHIITYYSSFYM